MNAAPVADLAKWLEAEYSARFTGSFPYEDCRKLISRDGVPLIQFRGLIPDLDLYFGAIAGRASRAKTIVRWSSEEIGRARDALRQNFFEMHPEYLQLETVITAAETPELHEQLLVSERLRKGLLDLLTAISAR